MDKLKFTSLGVQTDTILDVKYGLGKVESAKELADKLKSILKKNNINYADYNGDGDDGTSKNPPTEIYEYQNFFVLQRKNGDLVLLDGFRRLLWYNAPSTPILVRIYNESELTDQQILTLLVNLNHFKFFSDQHYHERGFSLLLKTVFDIDIMKMKSTFDAYLSSDETKNSYSSYGRLTKQSKNEEIKRRIVNKFFISDLRFLQALQNERFLSDQYMGALVYEMRKKSDTAFDSDKFIALVKDNKVLLDLMDKYKKVGTDHSSKSQEVVNKIIEMYRNIFTIMEGGEVQKSFAEQQTDAKAIVEKFKKDKGLVKMTGSQQITDIERAINKLLKEGKELEFVCVVHPYKHSNGWQKPTRTLPYGILEGVKVLGYEKKHLDFTGNLHFVIGFEQDGEQFKISHNYGSGAKKYTTLNMGYQNPNYDVDLFVRMETEKKPKSTEPRQMKKFSYSRGRRQVDGDICVLAWTQKEAREIFESLGVRLSDNDMRQFVGHAWGTTNEKILEGYDQSQPCAYEVKTDKTVVKLK